MLLFSAVTFGADLTPSVNYFSFDYHGTAMSDQLDSIVAGRYEILVADGSYGSAYVNKYNDLHAWDPDMEYYVYHNFNNPQYGSASQGPLNDYAGPRMEADGHDSTHMYWHSEDYTSTDWGHYEAYATSEVGSRLRTYNGTRPLVNNTDMSFIHHYIDYAQGVRDHHSGRNYEIAGVWFDNMAVPQPLGVGNSSTGRHCHETSLGGPTAQYGNWTNSPWQTAYRDTVLLKYMSIIGDSLKNRLNLKVCINAMGWGYGLYTRHASGYNPEYFNPTLAKPVNREYEFGLSPHDHNQALLWPGPTNSASSIVTSTVAAGYSPIVIYAGMVASSPHDMEHWFSPGQGYLEYGFRDYWYDCLAMYYLIRGRTTYISFANKPEARLEVLNQLDGAYSDGRCVAAGNPGDSCYWIDALGERVGRDGNSSLWDTDVVNWYAASVDCPDCQITNGFGKDADSQNWVIFSRRWSGDDGYEYMTLLRPAGVDQESWAGSHSPIVTLTDGPWQKMDQSGSWSSNITTDRFENGRGGIYRRASGECAVPSSVPTLSSPANGANVTTTPTLCVNNSTPSGGCSQSQSYQFEVFSDVGLTTRVAGPSNVSEGSSTSCFTLSSALPGGRQYWWRARSYNGTAYSNWMGPYTFFTPNSAPSTPTAVSPANGSQVGTTNPTFVVGSSQDPDGSSIVYQFDVSLYSNFSSLIASASSVADTAWTTPTSLAAGNSYYWRCRCTDGIDWSGYSSVFSFSVVVNSAPVLNGQMTPDQGDTLLDNSPVLTVENGADANFDQLSYSFELWDAVGASTLAYESGISEGSGSTSWTIPISLTPGTYYRWRARCYDGLAYSGWTDLVQFLVISADGCQTPPSTPVLVSPADGAEAGTTQPQLCLENSTPSPYCSEDLTYVFEVTDDPSGPISSAEGGGTTCAMVGPSLQAGHTYSWRARAYNGTAYSPWSDYFQFTTPNSPPPAPAPDLPGNGDEVGTQRPLLGVVPVTDPDGSAVSYHFEVSLESDLSPLVSSGFSDTSSNWIVDGVLINGYRYYWRARAYDGIDYSPYSSTWQFTVNTGGNEPPIIPTLLTPSNGATVLEAPIVASVENVSDPDGDEVFYDFYLYSDPSLTQLVDGRRDIQAGSGETAVNFFTYDTPINNQIYYWYVRAHDGSEWSDPSNPGWFRYFSFATGVEVSEPIPTDPADGASFATTQPTLRIVNITDPGDHTYVFDVSTDTGFVRQIASSPEILQGDGGFTEWQLPTPLPSGKTYYWRCKVDNTASSATCSFSIKAEVYVYPNPFSLSSGEPATFQLLPQPTDLLIQTVSGDPVLLVENVSGQWQWDGRNESGNQVSVGVYLWFASNGSFSGKIVVKP